MTTEQPKPQKRTLVAYIRIFLLPTLVLKGFIMYFGLNYAMYPDRGYGTGLLISMALALCNFGYFLYVHWNDSEDDAP